MTEASEGEDAITQDLYDCSVAYMDNEVRNIMEVLDGEGILENTAIVITADHGEGLGIHGVWGHGLLYEDTIHIPLILWRPGLLPEGVRVKGFAQHVDVAPSLLDLVGISGRGEPLHSHIGSSFAAGKGAVGVSMEGKSLLPQIRGEERGRDFIVMEVRRGPSDPGLRAFRSGRWKFVESLAGDRELYNLDDDPLEKVNLAGQDISRARAMAKSLRGWAREHLEAGKKDPMRIWPVKKK